MKRTSKVAALAAASIGLVLAAGPIATSAIAAGPAGAATATPTTTPEVAGAPAVTGANAQSNQAATLAYWTPARLRSAKPLDVIAAGTAQSPLAAPRAPTGSPGAVPGGAPLGATTATGGTVPQTEATPYDSFQVTRADTKKFPYNLNGALFFTNDGSNYVCSATSVASHDSSTAENEIWTAGHCVVNSESLTKVADSSAEFIPAYDGQYCCNSSTVTAEKRWAPYGIFTWNGGWETSTAWLNTRDLSEDEAAMTLDTSDITHLTVGQAVGWDGFTWNQPVAEQFVTFGYPAGAPYTGKYMEADIATTGGQDSHGGANPENPLYIGSPFTGGSSGGAWNIDWSDSGPGYIDGHNDYVYLNSSGVESPADQMYSPYQDSLSNKVRCFGASSC